MANDDITTIRLTNATKDRLDKYTEKKGDTYDDILNRILDKLEQRQKATT